MHTLASLLDEVMSGPPPAEYQDQLVAAFAAAAAFAAILALAFVFVSATYRLLAVFTRTPALITAVLVTTIVVIGLSNS